MSELKARTARSIADEEEMLELGADCPIEPAQVYIKSEADKVIEELKSDVADLRDDKKLTDAILDERNAEIAELKDKLQAANEQIENLINSASSIMLFQDRVKDNKCAELRRYKFKWCLAMAGRCRLRARLFGACGLYEKELWALKWHKRWLELAERFK